MSNEEKAKQELIEAYIECCKKRKEIESIKFCGMNEEEFVSVAKTYKALGKAPEDARLKYLIDNVDEKVLAEGKVKFLNDRTSVEQLALTNCAV